MKNYIQPGNVIDWTVTGSDVSSGDLVAIGELVGVATTDGAVGDVIAVTINGVFELPKVTGAIGVGAALYHDTAEVTTTASGNEFVGYATVAALSGDATVPVLLARGLTGS